MTKIAMYASFMALFFIFPAEAQVKIPCAKQIRKGRWKFDDKNVCIQQTIKEFRQFVDRLTQLKSLKAKIIPAMKLKDSEYKKLQKSWEATQKRWKLQRGHYKNLLSYNQKEAQVWRKAFYDLKKQKAPPKHWTQSPWLFFGIGVAVTVGVVAGSVALLNSISSSQGKVAQGFRYRNLQISKKNVYNTRRFRHYNSITKAKINFIIEQ